MEILKPVTLGNLRLENRVVLAPMCMYSAGHDGKATYFHVCHYGTRALGGVGLIIQEATAVESRGRITDKDLGIWDDEHIEGLSKIVASVHACEKKIAIQLAHSGRKSLSSDEIALAPSTIAYSQKHKLPKQMTKEDIQDVIYSFQSAARRAQKSGYDVIEIHAAHGYLINEFISPLTNCRTDEYGGCLENRVRFLKEIIQAIKKEFSKTIMIRVSAEEYDEAGHHIDDTIKVLNLIQNDISIVNVSTGGVVQYDIHSYNRYQIPYAKKIKEAGFTVVGGGLLLELSEGEEIINNHASDLVYFGKALLLNPFMVMQEYKKQGLETLIPSQYKRGLVK